MVGPAIDFAIRLDEKGDDGMVFLRAWNVGITSDEWPEFYDWINGEEKLL